jgi:all-trans-retinol 13,14-reductase
MSATPTSRTAALITGVAATTFVIFKILRFSQLSKQHQPPSDLLSKVIELEASEDANVRTAFTEKRFLKHQPADLYDVVFVGGGLGSLACAASLSRIGKRCLLLEQGDQLGGGAHVFTVPGGYEFETGVHYLGNDPKMAKLLDFLTLERLVLDPIGTAVPSSLVTAPTDLLKTSDPHPCKSDPGAPTSVMYDQIIINNESFPFIAGRGNLKTMLESRFPAHQDKRRIDAFFALMAEFDSPKVQEQITLFFRLKVVRILPMWLRSSLQNLICRAFLKFAYMSSEDMLLSCDISPASKLGMVILGQYGDCGMRPDKAASLIQLGVMLHYAEGSTYPRGGSGQIPRKLNNVIKAAGGNSFVHAKCTSLLFSDESATSNPVAKGVVVNGTTQIVAKEAVVSGIGVGRTYRDLMACTSNKHVRQMAKLPLQRIYGKPENCELSVAFIFLFVGIDTTDMPKHVEPDVRNHNTWIYPDFPDGKLDGYTEMEKRVFNPNGEGAGEPWSRAMPMFVASGSSKDSSYSDRFPNRKTVVVLSQCPFEWVAPWQNLSKKERESDASYQKFKDQTAEALMKQGFDVVFPHLRPYVKHTSVGTPLSTNTWLGTDQGECYGQGLTSKHLQLPDMVPNTPVRNLYQTGQDVVTLGVSGAMSAGYLTANAVAGYGSWENAFLQSDIVQGLGMPKLF